MLAIELPTTVLSVVWFLRWMASSPMFSTRVSAIVMWLLVLTLMPFWALRTVMPARTTLAASTNLMLAPVV